MTEKYDHRSIEKKWQDKWEESGIYKANDGTSKETQYILDMFPYPSGAGLHTGHVEGYTATDIYSRFKRMQGFEVLHPMGFDSFGLPAENYAIKSGVHPSITTEDAIKNFTSQMKALGFSYDWSREIAAHRPDYYKWTQWFFLLMFSNGLAEKRKAKVNWCSQDQTVLANEQVIDGKCDRCGKEVIQKDLEQWFFKITDYADELIAGLDTIDWPESTKTAQRNWIGRSEGAEISFQLSFQQAQGKQGVSLQGTQEPESIKVFTTRPDTLFGATYLVLAPEHPWIAGALQFNRAVFENADEVEAYVKTTASHTDLERAESKEKTGVELKGIKAINPANNEEIPVWIADYVIGTYGTGAIMAVPAHDERDFEFATKMNLPIKQVVAKGYVHEHGPGAYLPDEPTIEKDGVIVIVKHWSEDKYMGLQWKEVAWSTFLTGTVDEGETPEQTVLKEIREETGYLHARISQELGVIDGLFYHVLKKTNKLVHGHMFVVELEDGEQEEVAPEESAKHDIKWLPLDEMEGFLGGDGGTHLHTLNLFRNGYKPYTGSVGSLIESGKFTGLSIEEAKEKVTEHAGGRMKTTYKLRDWLVSRQRYWGAPIPIVYDPEGKPHAIPEEHLPWVLPTDVEFRPTGVSPLGQSKELAERTEKLFGKGWKPEVDTMDTFVCSSWYFFRFADPENLTEFASKELLKKWLPVDMYVGGAEHTVLHLLYARFFTKVLQKMGYIDFDEPFRKLRHQGIILAEDGRKMSKSLGNVVNPDDVIKEHGADTLRLYEMFMGPLEIMKPWSTQNIVGSGRFLERVWRLIEKVTEAKNDAVEVTLHRTIKKVGEDIADLKFNTAISAMMIFVNEAEKSGIHKDQLALFLRVLAPFAPHMAEEIWNMLGNSNSVHTESWPTYDQSKLVEDTIVLAVQVNGKTRATIDVSKDISEDAAKKTAGEAALKWLEGKEIIKTIYVAGRLVSFVVGE